MSNKNSGKIELLIYCEIPHHCKRSSGFAFRTRLGPASYVGCGDTLWYHPFLFAEPGSIAWHAGRKCRWSMEGKLCYRGFASMSADGRSILIDSFWPVSEKESDEADILSDESNDHRYVSGLNGVDSYLGPTGSRIIRLPSYMIALLPDLLPKVYHAEALKNVEGKNE